MNLDKLSELLSMTRGTDEYDTNTLYLPGYVDLRVGIYFRQPSYGSQRNRIVISGSLGKLLEHRRYDGVTTSITVSADKTDTQIAYDVQKRVLPDFLALVEAAKERYDVHSANIARADEVAKQISVVTSGKITAQRSAYKTSEPAELRGLASGEVAYDGNSITVHVTLPIDKALTVLKLIAES